jgi:hypothetical protein
MTSPPPPDTFEPADASIDEPTLDLLRITYFINTF